MAAANNPNNAALAEEAKAYFVISHNFTKYCNLPTTVEDQMKVDLFVKNEYKP